LVVSRRTLSAEGAGNTSSITSRSRYGARASIEASMVARSTFMSRLSGRYVRKSSHRIRLSGSAAGKSANVAATSATVRASGPSAPNQVRCRSSHGSSAAATNCFTRNSSVTLPVEVGASSAAQRAARRTARGRRWYTSAA
jgi:hypothetical protein